MILSCIIQSEASWAQQGKLSVTQLLNFVVIKVNIFCNIDCWLNITMLTFWIHFVESHQVENNQKLPTMKSLCYFQNQRIIPQLSGVNIPGVQNIYFYFI